MFGVKARITAYISIIVILVAVAATQGLMRGVALVAVATAAATVVGLERRSWTLLFVCGFAVLLCAMHIDGSIRQRAETTLLNLEGRRCFLYGTICDIRPSASERVLHYVVDIRSVVRPANTNYRGVLLLSLPVGSDVARRARLFDRMFVSGTVRVAEPSIFPWDYDERAFITKLGAEGKLIPATAAFVMLISASPDHTQDIPRAFDGMRKRIRELHTAANGRRIGELLTSMVIGSRNVVLDEDVATDFRNLGLTHMLAASGFNLAIVVVFSYFLFHPLRQNRLLVSLGAFLVLLFYVGLTGICPSIQRAALMCTIILFSTCWNREVHPIAVLSFALAITLVLDPWAMYDIGLQLSYLATAGLLIGFDHIPVMKNVPIPGWGGILATMTAEASVVPLQIYYFWQMGLLALPANMMVSPLVPVLTVFAFVTSTLGCMCSGEFPCLLVMVDKLGGLMVSAMTGAIRLLNCIPHSVMLLGPPSPICVWTYYISLAVFLLSRRKTWLSVLAPVFAILSLCGLFYRPPLQAPLAVLTNKGALVIAKDHKACLYSPPGKPDYALTRACAYLGGSHCTAKNSTELTVDPILFSNFHDAVWFDGARWRTGHLTNRSSVFVLRERYAEPMTNPQLIRP